MTRCQDTLDTLGLGLGSPVSVLAENVTLKWDTPIPLSPPADVHMCCLVKNSRPPAEIRWFRGPDDISEQAQYTKHVLKTNGTHVFECKV